MLLLILVIGALLGVLVLWFTLLRHERTVRHRAGRRPAAQPSLIGASDTAIFNGGGVGAEVSDGDSGQDAAPADGHEDAVGVETEADTQDAAGEPEPSVPAAESETETEPDAEPESEPADASEPESESEPESTDESASEPADESESDPSEPAPAPEPAAPRPSRHRRKPAKGQRRKLTDDILSRVEAEIAGRETWHYKDLAALVHSEFGVAVHPSTIQRAIKRRRAEADDAASAQTADPAADPLRHPPPRSRPAVRRPAERLPARRPDAGLSRARASAWISVPAATGR